MILCLQCADLSMTFRLWKFQKLRLYTEHVITSCAHSQVIKGLNIFSGQRVEHWGIKCKDLGSNSNYLDTGFNKMQGMTYMTVHHGQLVTPTRWMYETQDETLHLPPYQYPIYYLKIEIIFGMTWCKLLEIYKCTRCIYV